MKYPQRGQIILQWRDASRAEHAGQNSSGNSSRAPFTSPWVCSSLMATIR
jgi:hypothetical protein